MARSKREKRPERPPWSWPGVVALVLAIGLSIGWCGSILISSTPWGAGSHEDLLNGIGQVMTGALATYLGAQIVRNVGNGQQVDELEPEQIDEPEIDTEPYADEDVGQTEPIDPGRS